MAYLVNTPAERQQMLDAIGAASVGDLFDQIPAPLRMERPLAIPPALTELELESHLRDLASRNGGVGSRICFLGGGAYDHFIPAAVDAIASRSEFYTAYTPYQAEASQGSLQAFFEYQSLICQLTGLGVANASLYEGGTAVSEAVFMAMRVTDRHRRVVVLGSVHPQARQVCQTYLNQIDCELVIVPTPEGMADVAEVVRALNDQTACLVIQSPNYLGCLEQTRELCAAARKVGALAIVSCQPLSLGLLTRPGDVGADIAVAEGQSLGIPLQYGGPYLGVLACREEYVRKMPGRLIGETVDREGRRTFVLNLQAREQHIRRDKATSNICTNQGLMALRATVFLSLLGPQGLRETANLCLQKAHYAAGRLAAGPGLELVSRSPFFLEFAIRCRGGAGPVLAKARQAGFDLGPALGPDDVPGLRAPEECLLVAVTEQRTREQIDRLADLLSR
ncbi:MAG: aminomethyl-transferring glycine dehydrogenase subunit GcvPA [Planctomycetaceae bacterium]